MALTPQQLPALKAEILAETNPDFVFARENGQTGVMASFFNAEESPAFYLYRANYTPEQIVNAIEAGGTQLDGLTASKRECLLWWSQSSHDMRTAICQSAANDYCGTQNALKTAVLDGGKRKVTRGERIYCTGTGSLAAPGTSTYEGAISDNDVSNALQLP
jgi:hypothetical protein